MWFPTSVAILACLSTFALAEQTQANVTYPSASEILEALPSCASNCLLSVVPGSACGVSDVECICTNQNIQDEAERCILKSCPSLVEALSAKNITATACHAPVRDRSGQYVAVSIALGTIAVLFVVVRLVFKQFFGTNGGLAPDDKVILGTLALRITCIIINVQGLAAHGVGKDTWTLQTHELTLFTEWLYIMEILYLAELSLIKLSLSLFFVRIFPGQILQKLLWATVIFNVVYGAAFVITAIFQCTPVSFFWTQYVEQHAAGKCININAFGWANAAISVALDIWMLGVPLSQIPKLKLHWTKKIGVALMFVLGAFVTIVSILRLSSLVSWANSTNPTWDQWNIVYWSTIEVNVGMICTCLPSLRLIMLRTFPNMTRSQVTHNSASFSHHTAGQSGLDRRTTGRDHHLSDLDQTRGHTWTRIESEPEAKV